jgi:integrase
MSLLHSPPRLVKGKDRWYIIYYQVNPLTGKRERFRETHGLNRIKNLRERIRHAQAVIRELNRLLPNGYPFGDDWENPLVNTPVSKAIERAFQIKEKKLGEGSVPHFRSVVRSFLKYLKENKIDGVKVCDFDRYQALKFLDYCVDERGISATTYNNYRNMLSSLFNELQERNFISKNPFSGIAKRKGQKKKRRAFTDYEKTVIAGRINQTDQWLMLAVLLQYHCFIRPSSEMRRLRFDHFDLQSGLIRMEAGISKNKKEELVTIPNSLLDYLHQLKFEDYPKKMIIFGPKLRPHSERACGKNEMNRQHRSILQKLEKEGKLPTIEGLSFYSWKDTGALELFRQKVNILEIKRQLRHKDLATTQKYCEMLYSVNTEIKRLDNKLL